MEFALPFRCPDKKLQVNVETDFADERTRQAAKLQQHRTVLLNVTITKLASNGKTSDFFAIDVCPFV